MLDRRTKIQVSTMRTPTNAAIDDAWPDGNDRVVSSVEVDGLPVRAGCGPSHSLKPVVSSEVAIIDTTAKTIARRCRRASRMHGQQWS